MVGATVQRVSAVLRRFAQITVLTLVVGVVGGWNVLHKSVTVDVDGVATRVETFASSVSGVLDEAGVQIGPNDLVAPALEAEIGDGGRVVVRTASPFEVVIDGESEIIMTSARTVGELLASLGPRADNALVTSSRSARVHPNLAPLHVSTEKTARVLVDGEVIEGRTTAPTVGEMLSDWGIYLHDLDTSSVPLSAATEPGLEVEIGRHSTTSGTEVTTLPFKTVEVENDEMLEGTKKTVTPGKAGSRVVTYRAIHVDGEEVDREILTEALVGDPVDEVIHVGTKPEPEPPEVTVPDLPEVKPGSNRDLGRELAAARGWGDDQFKCLDNLWTRESNWRHTAENRSSGAYGIPQALPGSKMGSVASDWRTNPATQIEWGLNYIKGRYSTPCGAWGAFQSKGWY